MTATIGDHVRDLAHLNLDLVLEDRHTTGTDGHEWYRCAEALDAEHHHWVSGEYLVDSVGLLRAAAAHAETRITSRRRAVEVRDHFLRAASDHQGYGHCPSMTQTGRACLYERNALDELALTELGDQ